jgi:hypothetical protein
MVHAATLTDLTYPLGATGHIDHWLVAGPFAFPVPDLDRYGVPPATGFDSDYKLQILRDLHQPGPDVTAPPTEGETLTLRGQAHPWQYARCRDDHQVDLSTFCHICHHLVGYAYAVLETATGGATPLVLDSNGPADLWINGEHIGRHEQIGLQDPRRALFAATLRQGRNEILVRFEAAATRACPFTLALRATEISPATTRVLLPTDTADVARRQAFAAIVEAAYCTQGLYTGARPVAVRWEGAAAIEGAIVAQLLDSAGTVRAAGRARAGASGEIVLIASDALPDGPYEVVIGPDEPSPVRRTIAIRVLRDTFAEVPEGTLASRRRAALEHAARQPLGRPRPPGHPDDDRGDQRTPRLQRLLPHRAARPPPPPRRRSGLPARPAPGAAGVCARLQVLAGRAGRGRDVLLDREPPDPLFHLRGPGRPALPRRDVHQHRADRALAPREGPGDGARLVSQARRRRLRGVGIERLFRGRSAGPVAPLRSLRRPRSAPAGRDDHRQGHLSDGG